MLLFEQLPPLVNSRALRFRRPGSVRSARSLTRSFGYPFVVRALASYLAV